MFVDLVAGTLPWSVAVKQKDKALVGQLKSQYVADPRELVAWVFKAIFPPSSGDGAGDESLEEKKVLDATTAQTVCNGVVNM